MDEYIEKNKTTHEMWQNLYELEDKLEKEHGLDICERHDVQIGFEAGLEAVVNMPTIDIVRCKDCKYCKIEDWDGDNFRVCTRDQHIRSGSWFCGDAERSESNG